MINPNKAIVLIAEERNTSWPKEVPSAPHPIILRIKEDKHPEKKTIVYFEHGITGFESYYMEDFMRGIKESKNDKITLNAGNEVYSELVIDKEQALKAVEALTSSEKCIWMAHVSTPLEEKDENDKPKRDFKVLFDDKDLDPKEDSDKIKAHFEVMMGIDPNRSYADLIAQTIRNKVQHSYVHEVMLVPESYKTMPHFVQSERMSEDKIRESNQKVRELREQEEKETVEKAYQTGIYSWKGKLKYTPDTIGKGENSGVKGKFVTKAGNIVNFVAFGEPGKFIKSIAGQRNQPEITIGGKPNPQKDTELKLVFAQKNQEKDKNMEMER